MTTLLVSDSPWRAWRASQRVTAFPGGRPYAYRISEPRVFILSATFDP